MAEDQDSSAAPPSPPPPAELATAPTEPAPAAPPDPSPVAPSEAAEPAGGPGPIGIPLDAFVRFGTTSSRHDQMVATQLQESRRRRAEDDEEKRIARERGLQAGLPGEVASRYTNQFTDTPEIARAYVPLEFVTRTGREITHRGVGDIIMVQDPAFPNELAVVIFCPSCIENFHLPPDQSILTIRQSNRMWHLDQRKAGELCVFEDGTTFRSAGVIRDGERFTCGRCSWRARIDNNRVWPD